MVGHANECIMVLLAAESDLISFDVSTNKHGDISGFILFFLSNGLEEF